MVALAREIPGFGGYWYESPGGRLVIGLTEAVVREVSAGAVANGTIRGLA